MKKINRVIILLACIAMIMIIKVSWEYQVKENGAFSGKNLVKVDHYNIVTEGNVQKITGIEVVNATPGMNLAIYSYHKEVTVYKNDELVYSLEKNDFGNIKTTGEGWSFIPLDESYRDAKIKIMLKSIYPVNNEVEPIMYLGSIRQLQLYLLKQYLFPEIICVILILMGILLIVSYLVLGRKNERALKLLKVGIYAIVLGFWSANQVFFVGSFFNKRIFMSYISYVLLMLIPLTLVMSLRDLYQNKKRREWDIIVGVCTVNIIITIALQLLGILDFRESLSATHIVIVLSLLTIIYMTILEYRTGKMTMELKVSSVMFFADACCCLIDMRIYYLNTLDTTYFTRMSFAMHIIALGIMALNQTKQQVEIGSQAEKYHEMAMLDAMTNMKNRTAFELEVEKIKKIKNKSILVFDLNNLKKCNDTFGHKMGDIYIVTAAKAIMYQCEGYGEAYRIGGDEFCIIVKKNIFVDIEQLVMKMNQYLESNFPLFNQDFGIAVGIARFDATKDQTIYDVFKRADRHMYNNKKNQKL